jgi:hypothetical protein
MEVGGSLPPLFDKVFFDIVDRVLGEVLVDFGNDSALHIGVEGIPQIGERACRGRNNDRLYFALAHELLEGSGDMPCEAMLLKIMPVGRGYAAAKIGAGALERAAWPIGALLVGGRVFVNEDALRYKIKELGVSSIAQKQCFSAISDEYESIVRDFKPAHWVPHSLPN